VPDRSYVLVQDLNQSIAQAVVTRNIGVRERLSGAYEFFEVSPLGPGELLAGKFLTYFGLVLRANLTVAAALVYLLGIPLEGGALMP
jgi:ABC-2 type transport system permease protein